MVKIALEIKNGSKIFKPKKGDLIMFDGKDWYVTTKEEVFKEYQDKVDAKLTEFSVMIQENDAFKREVSSQMVELSEIVRKFIKVEGDK